MNFLAINAGLGLRSFLCISVGLLGVNCFAVVADGPDASSIRSELTRTAPAKLNFERNDGQYGPVAAFVARGPYYCLELTPAQVALTLRTGSLLQHSNSLERNGMASRDFSVRRLSVQLVGANPRAAINGEGEISGRGNYLIGSDPSAWRAGVPSYQKVRVAAIYPGIDLLHYGNEKQLEYDFEIASGANPNAIALRFMGADRLTIDAAGELIVTLGADEIRQPKPIIYQVVTGQKKIIAGGYVLTDSATVKFWLGEYDHSLALVIDPVVSYSNLVAGASGSNDEYVRAIAIGVDGSVYMAGESLTAGAATTNAFQTNLVSTIGQNSDVFVTRQNNQATEKIYFTYLGGSGFESALGLTVDEDGNAYVTGYTASTNFPTRQPVQASLAGAAPPGFTFGAVDAFVAKIGPYGSNLVFSTYYGGAGSGYSGVGDDVGFGIALDSGRNVFVAGYTTATNFPTANTAFTNVSGVEDAFVLKLGSAGTNVLYALRLGGPGRDIVRDLAVDAAGNPVFVGSTASTNFPVTTNALQGLLNGVTNITGSSDAFITKLDGSSGGLVYSTFVGGTNNDQAVSLALGSSGAVYATGWTLSGNFPRTSTNFSSSVISNATASDVFVLKYNLGNTNLDYAVVFGGSADDEGAALAVDSAGAAHVTGITKSANFPTNSVIGKLSGTLNGASDAFVSVINSNGAAFQYSAYLGSSGADLGYDVALDQAGNSYYVGEIGVGPRSSLDGYILKILPDVSLVSLSLARAGTNAVITWPGFASEFNVESRTNLVGTNAWTTISSQPVLSNNVFQITLPATNAPRFFRLKRSF